MTLRQTNTRRKFPDIPTKFSDFITQFPEYKHGPRMYACPVCYEVQRAMSAPEGISIGDFLDMYGKAALTDGGDYERHRSSKAHTVRRALLAKFDTGWRRQTPECAGLWCTNWEAGLGYLAWLDTAPAHERQQAEAEGVLLKHDDPDFDDKLQQLEAYLGHDGFVQTMQHRWSSMGADIVGRERATIRLPTLRARHRRRGGNVTIVTSKFHRLAENWWAMHEAKMLELGRQSLIGVDPQYQVMPVAYFLYLNLVPQPEPKVVAPVEETPEVTQPPESVKLSPPPPPARARARKVFLKPDASALVFGRVRLS